MDIVILIGRILFAAIFIGGALGHFTNTQAMAAYCESSGLRPGRVYVIASGIWMLVAIALVVLGAWADLGAAMLVIFLLPTAVLMHPFWRHSDAETRMNEQIQFSKDVSLAGAALFLFGFVVATGDALGLTLTGPLFG
ncbi:DoxX family protein [Nocardia asteroides]|uniref:DoxX family protein n=1 Tax=Nocardia asteroides TaxID=1824 RepID=UPI001E513840|nr:DoxX family protein [Nocardia asteroides]UGT61828.1 DoxX family protein [Nocardia asteroides]